METWSPDKTRIGEKPQGKGWVLSGYKPREKLGWTGPKGVPLYVEVPIYTRQTQPTAAAPPPAPAPAPAPAPEAPPPSAESTRYRDEAADYMRQAEAILNQFRIDQSNAAAAAAAQQAKDEEARKLQEQLAIRSQATMAANLARQQQTPNLQIQPAAGTPQTAGTQGFKRRQQQFMPSIRTMSGINVPTSNVLNI